MGFFKKFDIVFLGLLALAAAYISEHFLGQMSTGFYYSLKTAVLLVAMIRWGTISAISVAIASIGGVLFTALSLSEFLLFGIVADMFLIIPIAIYANRDRDLIVKKWYLLVLFVLASYISLAIGKGLAIFMLTGEATGVIDFFATSFFTMCMDILVLLLLTRVNGLLVDVKKFVTQKGTNDG